MYANLLENRNRSLSDLIKLGKCVGRSLRENVKLFSVDAETQTVTYITESEHIIEGNYETEDFPTLKNIVISSTEVIKNDKLYEEHVNSQIGTFIGDLLLDNHSEANMNFDKVLNLWENKLRLVEEEKQLKIEFNKNKKHSSIVETSEFYKLVELSSSIVDFLKENKEELKNNKDIINSLTMSTIISEAFDLPRITIEELKEAKEYILKDDNSSSVFDILCKQELLKQEIYESKKSFDKMWVNNPRVQKIVSNLFEQSDSEIYGSIVEAVTEIPYFALATKKQLTSLISNSISMNEGIAISDEEIRSYASTVFEINKPIKEGILEVLNEKYGINVSNLKDIPSFKLIIENQIKLFKTLSDLAPEKSSITVVCNEMAKMLTKKNGVQSIDLNDFTNYLFEEAEYEDILIEKKTAGSSKVDFKKIMKDVDNLEGTFKNIKTKIGHQYDSDEGQESSEKSSSTAVADKPTDSKSEKKDSKEEGKDKKTSKKPMEDAPVEDPAAEDEIDAEIAAAEDSPEAPKNVKELNKNMQAMEDLIANLASEFGVKDLEGSNQDDGSDDEGSTNK